jgi:hypothetical protein
MGSDVRHSGVLMRSAHWKSVDKASIGGQEDQSGISPDEICVRRMAPIKGLDFGAMSDTPESVEDGRFTLAVYTSVTFVWPPLNVGDPHVSL